MIRKLVLVLSLVSSSFAFAGDTYVDGYTRSDGTYVQGHYRSKSDSSTDNNYSTDGNINPYTGRSGSNGRSRR